jgi:hypothetical protein
MVAFTLVSSFLISLALRGIISFENSGIEAKPVLLQKLLSSLCWLGIEYYTLGVALNLVKFLSVFKALPLG